MTDVASTRKVYDTFGKEYHKKRLSPEKNFWNLFIDAPAMEGLLKPVVKGKRVLDAGCGSGIFTAKLREWGAYVTGCDLSKTLIGIAKQENPGIPFTVCDVQKTPFNRGAFDIVSSNLVLHYLKDPRPFFAEMRRVLRPNGELILSFHHPFNESIARIADTPRQRFEATPYFHNKKYTWMMDDRMRMISYHHTFEHIALALHDTGFVITKILEPRPSRGSRQHDPRSYDRTVAHPSFCIIQARKA